MRRILVVALHKLGDNMQVTPIFRSLKKQWPDAEVSVLTEKPFQFPFEHNPHVDSIYFFNRAKYTGGGIKTLAQARSEKEGDVAILAQAELDLIVNRQSSFEGAALTAVIGAREMRGLVMCEDNSAAYDDPWTRLLFAGCQVRSVNPFNFVDYGINVAGGLDERHLDLCFDAEKTAQIFQVNGIQAGDRIIAVQPGSNSPMRRWNAKSFAKAAELLLGRRLADHIIVLGSPNESPLAQEILSFTGDRFKGNVYDLTKQVSLEALPGLLKVCKLLITNDTGPMHVAAAAGCPVIALYFGESFVNETGPYGPGNLVIHAKLPCLPCTYVTRCERNFVCREMVKPEHIAALVDFALGNANSLEQNLFRETAVYFSGRDPLKSEIRFRPLLKPVAQPEDVLRGLYRSVFKQYLDGTKVNVDELALELNADYADMGLCLNRMQDLDIRLVNLFSRQEKERTQLLELVKEGFVSLRAILT